MRKIFGVILVSLFFCCLAHSGPMEATVASAAGREVSMIPPDGKDSVTLKKGSKIPTGSLVRTGAKSRAVILLTPRSAIRMSSNSEMYIDKLSQKGGKKDVLVSLRTGSIGALVKEEKGTIDFRVKTPSGIAAAKGTFFSVVVENGEGYTQVKEGKVAIIPLEMEEDGAAEKKAKQ